MRRIAFSNIFSYVICVSATLVILTPVVWLILSSLKPSRSEIYSLTPTFIFEPTLKHYFRMFTDPYFAQHHLTNSLIIAGATAILCLICGMLAAYAITRLGAAEFNAYFILALRFMPAIAIVIPMYTVWSTLHLIDTHFGMVLAYSTFNLPFAVWLMFLFMRDVPTDIDDAARMDGMGRMRILFRVIAPIAAPGIAVTVILCFLFAWNEYLMAVILTRQSTITMPLFLTSMRTMSGFEWELLYSGTVMQIIPVFILVFFLQKHIVRGLTLGAVK